jgi:hypothetical protein
LREAAEKVEQGLQRVGEEVRLLCLLARLRRDLRDPAAADAASARAKASVQDAEDARRLQVGCR